MATTLLPRGSSSIDTLNEGNETFQVTLNNAVNGTITTGLATGTILNDDAVVAVSIGDLSIAEGTGGIIESVTIVTGTVCDVDPGGNVTAIAGVDYAAASGQLSFAAGAPRTARCQCQSAATPSMNRTKPLRSSSAPVNAALATTGATGTIVENDALPSIRVTDATVT
jgi:hypothetical protein